MRMEKQSIFVVKTRKIVHNDGYNNYSYINEHRRRKTSDG